MPTVTSKGQVTIPREVREAMGLVPGSHVEFVIEGDRVTLRKRIPPEVFDRWAGYLRGRLLTDTVDEEMELMRGERLPPDDEPQ
ncbi:MAG TPA: AbrB/MazE/SpoVT family DNA-binding domain-containing protein [Chloroflexota bacterium]|jgi:AbrB family looped-hinge helix DNA binding protein